MKKLLVGLALLSMSCTDEEGSHRALKNSGFTDIEFTGYSPFACSKDDNFSTGFRAKNPRGQMVSGTVCCGILKDCTIRF